MIRGEPPSPPTLAFSTLGCPDWTWRQAVDHGSAIGFDAIEWRGGPEGHVSPRWSAGDRAALRRRMASRGIGALAVTAYSVFASPDPAVRAANAADLSAHVELAADLGARAVRTFLGSRDEGDGSIDLVPRVGDALRPVVERAAGLGVAIAIEPHDDFVDAPSVAAVLQAVGHENLGVVWDVANAWAEGESPDAGLAVLGPWIRYVQLKDGTGRGATWRLTAIGEGEVPLEAAVTGLAARGPLPALCFEWERAWHPDLAPAGEALPVALAAMRSLADVAMIGS